MKLWIAIGALVLLTVAGIYQTSAQTPAPSTRPAASSPATSPATTQPDNRQVFKVKTAEEFVKAIGPDRIIQLAPGEYNLTDLEQRRLTYARWDKAFDGYDLIIRDVNNLRIEGVGDKRVRIVVKPSYIYVLGFEKVKNVELINLEMGHLEEGYCSGGVVQVVSGENFTIRDCDLYGCGMEGLTLEKTMGFQFIKSIVRDCSYGIMTVTGCEKLSFKDSRFKGNKEFHGFVLHDSAAIEFCNCLIEGNKAKGPLFEATSCSKVTVSGGTINGNTYTKLMDPAGSVKTDKVDFAGNKTAAEPKE